MKVKELIEFLEKFDGEKDVHFWIDPMTSKDHESMESGEMEDS
jgi:hypothetical protein